MKRKPFCQCHNNFKILNWIRYKSISIHCLLRGFNSDRNCFWVWLKISNCFWWCRILYFRIENFVVSTFGQIYFSWKLLWKQINHSIINLFSIPKLFTKQSNWICFQNLRGKIFVLIVPLSLISHFNENPKCFWCFAVIKNKNWNLMTIDSNE